MCQFIHMVFKFLSVRHQLVSTGFVIGIDDSNEIQ